MQKSTLGDTIMFAVVGNWKSCVGVRDVHALIIVCALLLGSAYVVSCIFYVTVWFAVCSIESDGAITFPVLALQFLRSGHSFTFSVLALQV